jgi:hypothetical protein
MRPRGRSVQMGGSAPASALLYPGKATVTGTHEKRRVARIPLACTVVVREKLATWTTDTQDVGARGCRIRLSRPLAPGALVRLTIERDGEAPPLDALGQVAWARKSPPLSAGVTFVTAPRDPSGASAENWIDTLVAVALRRLVAGGPAAAAAIGALGGVTLHLGTPPAGTLARDELVVLGVARKREPLSAVVSSLDALGALARLIDRGAVTVRRPASDQQGWEGVFSAMGDVAAAAPREAASGSLAVIVPPLPEPTWRRTAVEAREG